MVSLVDKSPRDSIRLERRSRRGQNGDGLHEIVRRWNNIASWWDISRALFMTEQNDL